LMRLRTSLIALFIVNVLGTIYGYVWYQYQLIETPAWLRIVVPDSPTASLFFCFVLLLWFFKKQSGLIEALAYVSLVKYGIWAVAMNLAVLNIEGQLNQIAIM
ncbi:DUF1405 domain-containing protein, partial [Pseudomonas sp. FW305-BF6]|uniref:DUF1405 domain-containing protein n=1 Tax=Pseudomonas sp. FW305-BF6 TaxID=2070673 RepID=UPI001C43A4E1